MAPVLVVMVVGRLGNTHGEIGTLDNDIAWIGSPRSKPYFRAVNILRFYSSFSCIQHMP
jgi:hypothetical protein